MAKDTKEKLWHKSYLLGPRKLASSLTPYPERSLYTILDDSAARNPFSPAVDYCGSQISYKELKHLSDSLAAALVKLGVRHGDRVATVLPTCPQYIISAFAIVKAGAVHVPCGNLHPVQELAYELKASGTRTVIIQSEYLKRVLTIIPAARLRNIIVTSKKDFTPEQNPNPKARRGVFLFRQLIENQKPQPAVSVKPRTDLSYLAFTGGATGRPKGVMLTHFNRLANVRQGLPWMLADYEKRIRGRGSVVVAVPLFHSYGDWVMLSAIYWGLKIILVQDPRDIDGIAALMIKNRPFLTSVVPTQLVALREKDIPRIPGQIISGASHLPENVRKDFSKKTQIPVAEGYGLTEAGPVTHINLTGNQKHGIGVPVPDTEVVLMNEKTGKKCVVGEAGHMYLKGPQVMKGYWPTPGSGLIDGWLPTGDIARMDEDGFFYLEGRIKDMVNISGYKVYPSVIEDILYQHPAVFLAAVIGIPDLKRDGSERIKAFIQLKEEYKGKINAAEIISFCKNQCPPYAVPKFVEFCEDIPLTATQKPFKRKLRGD